MAAGFWNIVRPGKRWGDFAAELEAVIMAKPPEERARIFELFRGMGGLLLGLPADVGEKLYTLIMISAMKLATPGSSLEQLWPLAQEHAPNLIAAIRSYVDEQVQRET